MVRVSSRRHTPRIGLGLALGLGLAFAGGVWSCSQAKQPPFLGDPDGSSNDAAIVKDSSTADAFCTYEDGGCNTLLNCATQVYITQVAASAPAPLGGTVVAGTYMMTSYRVYTGSGGATGQLPTWFRQTMSLASSSAVDAGDAGDAGDASDADLDAGDADLDAGDAEAGAGPPWVLEWLQVSETTTSPMTTTTTGTTTFTPPSSVTFDTACPSGQTQPLVTSYTVTGNELHLILNSNTEITYLKQ